MREKGDLSLTDPHGWHWLSRGCPPWSLQEQWLCKKLPAAFLCSQWRYQGSLTHESRREKQTLISQLLSLPSMLKLSKTYLDFDIIIQGSPNTKLVKNEVSFGGRLAASMDFGGFDLGSMLGGLGKADICPRWCAAAG